MQPHEERVVQEAKELDEKIINLTKFVHGANDGWVGTLSARFMGLDKAEQSRMMTQLHIMRAYSTILHARINAFPTD